MIRINSNHEQLSPLWDFIKREQGNPGFDRLHAEFRYLSALSDSLGGKFDKLLKDAVSKLTEDIAVCETTTSGTVKKIEDMLAPMASDAKSYEFLCVSHAHIDMNWMWGYHETTAVVIATMRTMLDLLDEYPNFIFSQSQASVYRIIEEFAPDMFEEIKQKIKEGRWEIMASTWVEADKNMPSGESLARHILYTKKYMEEKFGIPQDELIIDFEPDTFGHSRNVPEIMNSGGVKYYYHFRGHVGEKILYHWKAPSGSDAIVYSDPFVYGGSIEYKLAEFAPEMARITGGKTLLKLYGVGDHGGGPTRRDLNKIIEMNSWPLFPRFTFGRLRDYFESVKGRKESLPLISDEINFVFDGCYTTQTRIKAGNLKAERLLQEAELFSSAAAISSGRTYPGDLLSEAWRKTLFNQFHDIVTGSGVTETREYASGLYQQVFAAAESARTLAQEAIAKKINTAPLFKKEESPRDAIGQGAGGGYGQTGRGVGRERVYHVFNSLPYNRREVTEITVWDYEGDFSQAAIRDTKGNYLRWQAGASGEYWGHLFDTLLVELSVPASGYESIVIEEKPDCAQKTSFFNDTRVQTPDTFILENEYIKVSLDPLDGSIASYRDKESGTEFAGAACGMGIIRLANECIHKGLTNWNGGMSSWTIGRFNEICNTNKKIEIVPLSRGPFRAAYKLNWSFGHGSQITEVISLDSNSRFLRYELICDWREFGSEKDGGVPNLHFYLPLNYSGRYYFDVPAGITERKPVDMDLPAQSFVFAENPDAPVSLALFSADKYGFRCLDKSLSLTLIRGSYDPDITPETVRHKINFAVAAVREKDGSALIRDSSIYRHPFTVISGKSHGGDLSPSDSLFCHVSGSVVVSAFKQAEGEEKKYIVRLYEVDGKKTKAEFALGFTASAAWLTDLTERTNSGSCILSNGGKSLAVEVPPYCIRTVIVELT
jgi:alpha-mannosidase